MIGERTASTITASRIPEYLVSGSVGHAYVSVEQLRAQKRESRLAIYAPVADSVCRRRSRQLWRRAPSAERRLLKDAGSRLNDLGDRSHGDRRSRQEDRIGNVGEDEVDVQTRPPMICRFTR
jgi:hypothetical protein